MEHEILDVTLTTVATNAYGELDMSATLGKKARCGGQLVDG